MGKADAYTHSRLMCGTASPHRIEIWTLQELNRREPLLLILALIKQLGSVIGNR
jgi:hypothetical protein